MNRGIALLLPLLGCDAALETRALALEAQPETDAPVLFEVEIDGRRERVSRTTSHGGALYAVDAEGVLFALGPPRVRIADRCRGAPAILPDGAVVVARAGEEPGETDLWIYPKEGPGAPLAPAPGGDDLPLALPDGRVAFVSTRSTVASWWVVDPRVGEPVQASNRGREAGDGAGPFEPTPAEGARVVDGRVVYTLDGRRVEVRP